MNRRGVETVLPGATMASVGGPVAAHAPWWTVLLLCGAAAAYGVLRMVFPQESADRLAWWKNRREYQTRRIEAERRDPS